VTLLWLIIWFICDRVGGREPLRFDPVNVWAGTLLLAVALDLSRAHGRRRCRCRCSGKKTCSPEKG
jgi:hypothetical protein